MNRPCSFCSEPLPHTQRPAFLAEHVETCPRCGAVDTVATDEATARPRLAERISALPEKIELDVSSLGDGWLLFVGWNPGELLSARHVADSTRKSKQVIQTHLREGRFPGAAKAAETPGAAQWQGRAVPRRGVRTYLNTGRKSYELSETGWEERAKAAGKRKKK